MTGKNVDLRERQHCYLASAVRGDRLEANSIMLQEQFHADENKAAVFRKKANRTQSWELLQYRLVSNRDNIVEREICTHLRKYKYCCVPRAHRYLACAKGPLR